MSKFFYIAAIFFAGYVFGDSAIRVAKVAYSEVSQVVKSELNRLGN